MKRTIIMLCTICFSLGLFAQDVLIKRNGEKIQVKVYEILPKEIKFKMYEDLEGPMSSMYKNKVYKIFFEDGSEQTFSPLYNSWKIEYTSRREPGYAALFSILLPGGGQYYNKDYGKGKVMTGMYVGGILLAIVEYNRQQTEEEFESASYRIPAMLIIGAFVWSVIDAPIKASIINHRYNLTDNYLLENDKFGLKIEPYFVTQTVNPGLNLHQTFPVYGAKMSITIK